MLELSATGMPTVQPVYTANNGDVWTYWLKRTDPATDIWHQAGTACDGYTETTFTSCFHAADKLQVVLGEDMDCVGTSAVDALGVFDWDCRVDGTVAFMYATLKQDKGLMDLIRPDGLGFMDNAVTLHNPAWLEGVASTAAVWWRQGAHAFGVPPANPAAVDPVAVLAGPAAGVARLYVLTESTTTTGYQWVAPHVALVVMPGAVLGDNTASAVLVEVLDTEYAWVEGALSMADAERGIQLCGTAFSMVRNITMDEVRGVAWGASVRLESTARNPRFNHLENVSAWSPGEAVLSTYRAEHNLFRNIRAGGVRGQLHGHPGKPQ